MSYQQYSNNLYLLGTQFGVCYTCGHYPIMSSILLCWIQVSFQPHAWIIHLPHGASTRHKEHPLDTWSILLASSPGFPQVLNVAMLPEDKASILSPQEASTCHVEHPLTTWSIHLPQEASTCHMEYPLTTKSIHSPHCAFQPTDTGCGYIWLWLLNFVTIIIIEYAFCKSCFVTLIQT